MLVGVRRYVPSWHVPLSGRCCWEFEDMCLVSISLSGRCC